MKRKEICYPFIFECCQFCVNNYWSNIFENLAYGIPPENCFIKKGNEHIKHSSTTFDTLCCYEKSDSHVLLQREDPEILYDKLMNMFINVLNLDEKIEDNQSVYYTKWVDIRKKNLKNILLENYVLNLKNEFHLSIEEAKNLLNHINMAISFKIINNKDIEIKYNANLCQITNITGILIDKNTNKPFVSKYVCDIPVIFESSDEKKKSFIEIWRKMLNE